MPLTIIPAIDLIAGRVVRLRQGDYARETAYASSPVDVAVQYAEAGATRLHLVDLDGAAGRPPCIEPVLAAICAATSLEIQVGGGLRNDAAIDAVLAAGATRVVIGTMAVTDPAALARLMGRLGTDAVVAALDVRHVGERFDVATHGWLQDSGLDLIDVLEPLLDAGLQHILATDISRDGMLAGPGLSLYKLLRELAPGAAIQASGGVRSAVDVAALDGLGVDAAIVGRALLDGEISLAELAAC